MNACCGHGQINGAYVQFPDGFSVHGKDAIAMMFKLKEGGKSMNRGEIDRLVAEKIMEWTVIDYKNIGVTVVDDGEFPVDIEEFKPSERIEDAWEIVKQLRRRAIQTDISSDGFTVKMYRWEEDKTPPYRYKRYLATVTDTLKFDDIPEMICRAALKSVGMEENYEF